MLVPGHRTAQPGRCRVAPVRPPGRCRAPAVPVRGENRHGPGGTRRIWPP